MSTPDEQEIAAQIGLNVRRAREAAGLTLRALAAQLGVTHSAIAHMEAGRRAVSAAFVVRVALALSVHPAALFVIDRDGLRTRDALRTLADGIK